MRPAPESPRRLAPPRAAARARPALRLTASPVAPAASSRIRARGAIGLPRYRPAARFCEDRCSPLFGERREQPRCAVGPCRAAVPLELSARDAGPELLRCLSAFTYRLSLLLDVQPTVPAGSGPERRGNPP